MMQSLEREPMTNGGWGKPEFHHLLYPQAETTSGMQIKHVANPGFIKEQYIGNVALKVNIRRSYHSSYVTAKKKLTVFSFLNQLICLILI